MSTDDLLRIVWKSPGPVSSAFMRSMAPVQIIQGPIGSGKTTTALTKKLKLARLQRPSLIDGVRRYKFCSVRDTYRQLWKTTIPSWWDVVPQSVGDWSGSDGAPATHTITFEGPDGNPAVELTAEFVAIGENKVEDVLRGYQVTSFYLNEFDLIAEEVFNYARGRAGRYPKMSEGGPSWWGVIGDMNAPDVDSHAYKVMVEKRPKEFAYFRQPSGFSPNAENLPNLPPGYYEKQSAGQKEWYIRRMIRNEFGYSRDGLPVFEEEYSDHLHVAPMPLEPDSGLNIVIGLDAGLTPAAGFWQRRPTGQWRGLHEIAVTGEGRMGAGRFGEEINRVLKDRFEGLKVGAVYADPSSDKGADKEGGEKSWMEIVSNVTGLPISPAPTNELHPRLEAIRRPLSRPVAPDVPGLVICPEHMPVTRRAFNSNYRYRRKQLAGKTEYQESPDKNEFSHIMDAHQYALLGGSEWHEVAGRQNARGSSRIEVVNADFDVLS